MRFPPVQKTKHSIALGLLCLFISCRTEDRQAPAEDRLSEFLDNGLARPLLLQDHRELLAYLRAFPRDDYNLCSTSNGFSYFIEKSPRLDGIKQVISGGQVWEGYFIELMAKYIKPGTAVVDAGAYIGTHSLAMARLVGPRGRVYAFEPQKKVFRELVFNLIENRVQNVIPMRFALGEANRIIEMDKPVDGLEAVVKVGRGGDPVELRTLDSFHLNDVSFLKIDVEDYEDPVLEGARQTIAANHNPPILIEKVGSRHRLEDYGYTVTPLEYRDYLALAAPPYRLGSIISFTDSGNAGQFRSGSWGPAESWGSWTTGTTADLVLPIPQVPQNDLILAGVVKAYVNERNPSQEAEVSVNGRVIDRWVFRDGSLQQKKARIPASVLQDYFIKPLIRVTFQIKNLFSPAELGLSGDKRPLGLGVREIMVREL
jgi:FkbM family methyltransferase